MSEHQRYREPHISCGCGKVSHLDQLLENGGCPYCGQSDDQIEIPSLKEQMKPKELIKKDQHL